MLHQSLQKMRTTSPHRDANRVAYTLTNVAKQFFIDKIWLEKILKYIRDVILKEKYAFSID